MNDREKMKALVTRVAKLNKIKEKELTCSISYFPAEDTWGVSVGLFFMEGDEYTTSNEFLVEMIDSTLEQCFSKIDGELAKLEKDSMN